MDNDSNDVWEDLAQIGKDWGVRAFMEAKSGISRRVKETFQRGLVVATLNNIGATTFSISLLGLVFIGVSQIFMPGYFPLWFGNIFITTAVCFALSGAILIWTHRLGFIESQLQNGLFGRPSVKGNERTDSNRLDKRTKQSEERLARLESSMLAIAEALKEIDLKIEDTQVDYNRKSSPRAVRS